MKIKLFAYLAEQLGPEINLELPSQFDKTELLEIFAYFYPQVAHELPTASVAVNQAFIFDEKIDLETVEEIAIIPPVSGG